jgi:3-phosphoshikimate 1-carboxyvinyltransferase
MIEISPLRKKIKSSIRVPGSKSYTNRAVLLAALAKGKSEIINPLESDDTKVTLAALKKLGIKVVKKANSWQITGLGGKFKKPAEPLYLGNAGTAVRFLTALLTIADFPVVITGDKRMQERPIQNQIDALNKLGANIKSVKNNGCPPLIINADADSRTHRIKQSAPKLSTPNGRQLPMLNGGKTEVLGTNSSQYLSALLMIGPYAKHPVQIKVIGQLTSLPYIKMTLDVMKSFGVTLKSKNFKTFQIRPAHYKNTSYNIEADASSATYPLAIAAINQGTITIDNLPGNSSQADAQFLDILKKMGCKVIKTTRNVTVSGPKSLKPLGKINLNQLPDAAMTVAIVAAFAKGKSVLQGLHNLRIKESDRLAALAKELKKVGVEIKEGPDFLEIDGNPANLHGAIIETYNDHRMAMCFAVAGSKIPGIKITNPACVSKTYPDFFKDLAKIGLQTSPVGQQDLPGNKSNIVLTGLRGTGKTAIGQNLARILNYDFIDTDHLIEKEQNKKIAQIVAGKGWPYFRKLENLTAKKLSGIKKTIIATGGGFFLNPQNTALLKKNGNVVLLTCPAELSAKRIYGDTNRPQLTKKTNPIEELKQLWEERKKIYFEAADLVFDTTSQGKNIKNDTQAKAEKIIALLNEFRD